MRNEALRIGVFDSGLGGLTVVKALQDVMKGAELFYIADTKNAPYGEKSSQDILQFSLDITNYFIENYYINALVIACNTATSAAIATLREKFPALIIIGTEPAIKPALEKTETGHIGILATLATLQGDKYKKLVASLVNTNTIKLYEQACPGLVNHIENNTLHTVESLELLEQWLVPMRESKVDVIVLGCTHYPLAKEVILEVMQKEVILLDSSHAIAQRLLDLLKQIGHVNSGKGILTLLATGKIDSQMVQNIIDKPIKAISL
jgi:glutamate racemase